MLGIRERPLPKSMFVTVWLTLPLFMLGCDGSSSQSADEKSAGNTQAAASRQLRGLSTVSGSKQIVFIGYRKDLAAELQDSLKGVATDEKWYRVELPAAQMPTKDKVASFDLATDSGITIVRRSQFHIAPNIKPYATIVWKSGDVGMRGALKISGADVVASARALSPDNTRWGVELTLDYRGKLDLGGGKVIKNASTHFVVGALVGTRVP